MPDSGFFVADSFVADVGLGLCRRLKRGKTPLEYWAEGAGLERLPVLRTGALGRS